MTTEELKKEAEKAFDDHVPHWDLREKDKKDGLVKDAILMVRQGYIDFIGEQIDRATLAERKRCAQWLREHAQQYEGSGSTTYVIMLVAADCMEKGEDL